MPLIATTRSSTSSTTCTTSISEGSTTPDVASVLNERKDSYEQLASRQFYSTTTALAITVGVGCILLVLNMLIFAGIYYQRDRDKKRAALECMSNGQESLQMTTRPTNKSNDTNNPSQEPPPSYTTLSRPPTIQESPVEDSGEMENRQDEEVHENNRNPGNSIHKDATPPKPPTRTTSSLSTGGTIKKRVQIQEISV